MNAKFDITTLEKATETMRAMAHPIRIVIIELLFEATQLSVKEIHTKIDIEQAVASHHLRIMKSSNIVAVTREGKNSFYSLTNPDFFHITQTLKTIIA